MDVAGIREIVVTALDPRRFFVAAGGVLRVEYQPAHDVVWEIFRGHLLDERQTRQSRRFESWNLWLDRIPWNAGPLLTVHLDAERAQLHVIRQIVIYAQPPTTVAIAVADSAPALRLIREYVGTVAAGTSADVTLSLQHSDEGGGGTARDAAGTSVAELLLQLDRHIRLAVFGTNRLPIISPESPLPAFSVGDFGYHGELPAAATATDPDTIVRWAAEPGRPILDAARLIETALRVVPRESVADLAARFANNFDDDRPPAAVACSLMRAIFNHVSLAPYTDFMPNLVSFVGRLGDDVRFGRDFTIDVLSYFLRHLARHLTAYDLDTFHNQGANYPDALTLDAMLTMYLTEIARTPAAFAGDANRDATVRLRRRALRQAWLARKQCEGLAVPDSPTSGGELLRVLPAAFRPVPTEQVTQPWRRRNKLFADEALERRLTPATLRALQDSMGDLRLPSELRELGMATYLDRPLGVFKAAGEIDRTPQLSYEAFSGRIADARLGDLHRQGWVESVESLAELRERRRSLASPVGFAAAELSGIERHGVISLEDARRASGDFVFRATTRSSWMEFRQQFDLDSLCQTGLASAEWLRTTQRLLLIRTVGWPVEDSGQPFLTAFDETMQPRLAFVAALRNEPVAYGMMDGVECLCDGLYVARAWELRGARFEELSLLASPTHLSGRFRAT